MMADELNEFFSEIRLLYFSQCYKKFSNIICRFLKKISKLIIPYAVYVSGRHSLQLQQHHLLPSSCKLKETAGTGMTGYSTTQLSANRL